MKKQGVFIHKKLDFVRDSLKASYGEFLFVDLIEKPLIDLAQNRDKLSIYNFLLHSALNFFRRLSQNWQRPRRGLTELFSERVIFVVSIENNLNSMLPVLRDMQSRGISCTILTSSSFKKVLAKSTKSIRGIDIVVIETMYSSVCTEVVLPEGWQADLKVITQSMKSAGYTVFEIACFEYKARQIAREQIAAIESLVALFVRAKPRSILAPRPKGITAIAGIMASQVAGVETIFMPHTTWFKDVADHLQLFDLSCFDSSVVYSKACAKAVLPGNHRLEVLISGWPRHDKFCYRGKTKKTSRALAVAFPCSRQYEFMRQIAIAVTSVGAEFLVKGHPPGDDERELKESLGDIGNVKVWSHNEVSLEYFLSQADIIICGKSNVGVEAATMGIPVISLYSDRENQVTQVRRRAMESKDIALWSVESIFELKSLIESKMDSTKDDLEYFSKKQLDLVNKEFPSYTPGKITDFVLKRASLKNISGSEPVSTQSKPSKIS